MSKKISAFAALLLLAVLASIPGLSNRWQVEETYNSVGFVLEAQDLINMGYESGRDFLQVAEELRERGLSAIAVNELTGEELMQGVAPYKYGVASDFLPKVDYPKASQAALMLDSDVSEEVSRAVLEYSFKKYPNVEVLHTSKGIVVVFPFNEAFAFDAGIMPDFYSLLLAQRTSLPIVYRPGSAPGVETQNVALALDWILSNFPGIKAIAPGGLVVAGFPDVSKIGAILKKHSIPVADIEFSKQLGASQLERAVFPMVLPLHSVTKEEIVSRRLSRDVLLERFARAAKERSVRLLYLRSPEFLSSSRLDSTIMEMGALKARLEGLGITTEWPLTYPLVKTHWLSYFALALVVYLLVWRASLRFLTEKSTLSKKVAFGVLLLALASVFPISKIGFIFRVYGAIAAAFGAFEGAWLALEKDDKPVIRILSGFLVVLAVGLVIAAVFGNTWYMLRMSTFSGVKLTLLVPPVLLLILDLKRRIHPESLEEVMSRPPLWGEIVLFVFLVAAAGILLIRSGNVSLVPGWEKATRDLLERLLIARPRTKELMIGYPCLVVWYYTVRCKLWPRYREVFRLGAVLAFASMVNSFCHFHTHLSFTLLRVFNGLWTGLLLGLLMVAIIKYVIIPAWNRWGHLLVE
ncbi:DUF5693 family protein [Thermovirga sp.]|uniref:DUF5693 family protein n=1 Tax=Thermovirga sp. TaxID=2699834 RepID=UPI0025F0FE4D|nr:DUF5693 family protein [Thermovirga sp.]MBO8153475.1 hypothetical protein [Thermovirga sp.]